MDCPVFFKYPILSQEQIKQRTLNLADTCIRSILTKAHLKFLQKRERGHFHGLPRVFKYPLLSQERVKLRTSNVVRTFI